MLVIAVVAIGLGGYVGLGRLMIGGGSSYSVQAHCMNKRRQVAFALLDYHELRNHFPSGTCPNPGLPPDRRLSWYAELAERFDYANIHQGIDRTEAWNAGVNMSVSSQRIPVLQCPKVALIAASGFERTNYIGIAGLTLALSRRRGSSFLVASRPF